MQARRTLLIAFLALFLAGCDFITPPPPSAEALAAQAEAEAYGARMAELTYLNRQAAVYNGCRFLVNVCPESITDVGRKAVEGNHVGGGGDSSLYWFIVFLKLFVLGLGAGAAAAAAWVTARAGWSRVVHPSRERLEQARKEVQTAKDQASRILLDARLNAAKTTEEAQVERKRVTGNLQAELERLSAEISDMESRKADLQRQNVELEASTQKAAEKLKALDLEIKRQEAAARAASVFD